MLFFSFTGSPVGTSVPSDFLAVLSNLTSLTALPPAGSAGAAAGAGAAGAAAGADSVVVGTVAMGLSPTMVVEGWAEEEASAGAAAAEDEATGAAAGAAFSEKVSGFSSTGLEVTFAPGTTVFPFWLCS